MRGMRRVRLEQPAMLKNQESQRIADEIKAFEANGGEIQKISSGVFGEARVQLTALQKKKAGFV